MSMLCFENTYWSFQDAFFFVLFCCLLHWMEKWSCHGDALEHLESSGTKSVLGGPLVRLLCKPRNINRNKDEFSGFFTLQ